MEVEYVGNTISPTGRLHRPETLFGVWGFKVHGVSEGGGEMKQERAVSRGVRRGSDGSGELSGASGVHTGRDHQRAHPSGASDREASYDVVLPTKPKPVRLRHVTVRAVSPELHPDFRKDRDHPFLGLSAAQRVAEIDRACAQLWARACSEQPKPPALRRKAA